jgi:hypothetical protein
MDMLLSLFEYCNTMIFASSIPSLHTVTPLFAVLMFTVSTKV